MKQVDLISSCSYTISIFNLQFSIFPETTKLQSWKHQNKYFHLLGALYSPYLGWMSVELHTLTRIYIFLFKQKQPKKVAEISLGASGMGKW